MKKYSNLFRGFASIFLALLIIVQIVATVTNNWAGRVNDTNGVKGYFLDAGTYYFAIGSDVHNAINNILAAKGATGMFDIDGTPVTGDVSKVASYELAEADADSYAYSKTGQRVTNVFFANYAVDRAY